MNTTTTTGIDSRSKNWPWIAACALGFVAWTALRAVSDHREAWDDSLYFMVLLPLVSLCAGVAGWLSPSRAPLVAPALAAGEFVGLFVQHPDGMNLWPITLAIFAALHVPAFLLAMFGARLRRRATPHANS